MMTVAEFFEKHKKVALACSGGVDSAYLLYAALQCGVDVKPYFIKTVFQPKFELEDAVRLAEDLGVELTIIEGDILREECVADNPVNRCYYCKRAIFTMLKKQALRDGYEILIDGTNASDDMTDRPGMQALQELRVYSPLRECGLTKSEIRRLSREAGIFTWDKPAYACLATRIPSEEKITTEMLQRIEGAEMALEKLGFRDFRVRVFAGAARIQLQAEQLERAMNCREEILLVLKPYFDAVLLDMEARKS